MVERIAKIRRDYHVRGKGIRRIVRERGVSRNTVREVIREGKTEFSYVRSNPPRAPKMASYSARLDELIVGAE